MFGYESKRTEDLRGLEVCVRCLPKCGGCGPQPLLTMLCEILVCEERRSEWEVGFGWSQVAVVKCFVNGV